MKNVIPALPGWRCLTWSEPSDSEFLAEFQPIIAWVIDDNNAVTPVIIEGTVTNCSFLIIAPENVGSNCRLVLAPVPFPGVDLLEGNFNEDDLGNLKFVWEQLHFRWLEEQLKTRPEGAA